MRTCRAGAGQVAQGLTWASPTALTQRRVVHHSNRQRAEPTPTTQAAGRAEQAAHQRRRADEVAVMTMQTTRSMPTPRRPPILHWPARGRASVCRRGRATPLPNGRSTSLATSRATSAVRQRARRASFPCRRIRCVSRCVPTARDPKVRCLPVSSLAARSGRQSATRVLGTA